MNYRIGGMFCLEQEPSGTQKFLENIGTEMRWYMSGRCALYDCLLDLRSTDTKKLAYVPAYTCETVLSSYEKAGYALRFYDIDRNRLTPLFRTEDLSTVSVLAVCGYYGFSSYDSDFVRECKQTGIRVIQDTTHSVFSIDGHCPDADYYAASFRKWMGVACGGVAIKKEGRFSTSPPKAPDPRHLEGRYLAMEHRAQELKTNDGTFDQKASEVFWETELRLREMFDTFGSDDTSKAILTQYDPLPLFEKRRNNYRTLLENLKESKQCQAVFSTLDESSCPSHFSFYSEDREKTMRQLEENNIKSTVYWPIPPQIKHLERFPQAEWVYGHIVSVQMDQRYSEQDMQYLGSCLSKLGNS